jgi:hypothetical protein
MLLHTVLALVEYFHCMTLPYRRKSIGFPNKPISVATFQAEDPVDWPLMFVLIPKHATIASSQIHPDSSCTLLHLIRPHTESCSNKDKGRITSVRKHHVMKAYGEHRGKFRGTVYISSEWIRLASANSGRFIPITQ